MINGEVITLSEKIVMTIVVMSIICWLGWGE